MTAMQEVDVGKKMQVYTGLAGKAAVKTARTAGTQNPTTTKRRDAHSSGYG